ncbi:MAG: hypothetical protein WCP85_09520 [Mariniphaga sp.]
MKIFNKIPVVLIMLLCMSCMVNKKICPCKAPSILTIGDNQISIKANIVKSDTLGRTTMKITIWLSTPDLSIFPLGVEPEYYYLRSSNLEREPFTGNFSKTNFDFENGAIILEATNNLKWNKDELIDVAVHLNPKKGKKLFIKTEAVTIQ